MRTGKSNYKLAVLLAGLVVTSLSTMGTAQATAYAYARNTLQDFKVYTSTPGASLAVTGTPTRTTVTDVTFTHPDGTTDHDGDTDPVALAAYSNALQARAGVSGTTGFPGENYWSRAVPAGLLLPNRVRADAETFAGSPIDTGQLPFTGVPFVNNVAEGLLATNSGYAATGAGTNSASAALTFTVTLSTQGTITFDFSDMFEVYASTTVAGESAQATIANIFTITPVGGIPFVFAPPEINTSCVSNSGIPATCNIADDLPFIQSSPLLNAGTYAISLFTSSAVTLTSLALVPEPGTGAIFMSGLASLGLILRRRRK